MNFSVFIWVFGAETLLSPSSENWAQGCAHVILSELLD